MVRAGGETAFVGFDIGRMRFETRIFECEHCPNRCEVAELTRAGELVDRYGHRCPR